jgi:basic membrane protein A
VDAPNVASVTFKDYEKSFLIGAFAAQMTKTNKVGIIGGMDIPLINAFAAGYTAGAKYVNKDVDVAVNYVGAWNDPNTAKEMAVSMYDNGADIIFAAAGGSGLGVFSGAKEKDKYAVGADVNQNSVDPDHIMLSAVRRVDNVIYDQIKSIMDGTFKAGALNLGLKENAVSYALEDSNIKVPQEYVDKVEELKKKIVDGEIKVPEKLEDVESFLSSNK